MEFYTLDANLRRNQVIEGFTSFIWTERYSDAGDFTIVIPSTISSRSLLTKGTWIAKSGSTYFMKIDTAQDQTDDTGIRNLTITGKSAENTLNDRVAMGVIDDLTTSPNWVLTGKPGDIVRSMFTQICVNGILSPLDVFPFIVAGTLLPTGNLGEPTTPVTVTFSPDTLFSSIKQFLDTYNLGFRLVRNGDTSQVYFEVYSGNNLTSDQDILNPVIFDPNMDNLENMLFLSSNAVTKTVAYVYASNGSAVVYDPNSNAAAAGFDRRVLLVNSSNSDPAGASLTTALTQEGLIALAGQRDIYSFDGELPPTVSYVYGRDYGLGDLVEERNSDGFSNQMLVTEMIFSSDDTGERQYPTLSILNLVDPNSWLGWTGADHWADVPATVHWADLP
jgi:hypothetical protein